jgi:hypothetical protein
LLGKPNLAAAIRPTRFEAFLRIGRFILENAISLKIFGVINPLARDSLLDTGIRQYDDKEKEQ